MERSSESVVFRQTLREPWFSHIKNGTKIVEGRLNKSWVTELKQGDIIIFTRVPGPEEEEGKGSETITVTVTDLLEHIGNKKLTFELLFDHAGLDKVLPGIKNNDEGVKVYRQWYSKEKEEKLGVVGIYLRLCRDLPE